MIESPIMNATAGFPWRTGACSPGGGTFVGEETIEEMVEEATAAEVSMRRECMEDRFWSLFGASERGVSLDIGRLDVDQRWPRQRGWW
jgi:hypothetical protein